LFGGVDTGKYTGDLVVLPLQINTETGTINRFLVTLSHLEVDTGKGKAAYTASPSISALLDSGTSLSNLPASIVNHLNNLFNVTNDLIYGSVVSCEHSTSKATLKFRFGNAAGPTIVASLSQFVIPFATGLAPTLSDGTLACRWGIREMTTEFVVLGDTFLRSAYVVYNLDDYSVAIAQSNFKATTTNIMQITNVANIPGAVPLGG
jgi:Eukaryotic aspartyl protease